MAVGLAALQTVLDEGTVYDSFDSPFIVRLSLLAGVMLAAFIAVELDGERATGPARSVHAAQFRLRHSGNFPAGLRTDGSAYLLPQDPAASQGFNAQQIGEVMAWTVLPQLIVIPFVPLLNALHRLTAAGWRRAHDIRRELLHEFASRHEYAAPQLLVPDITRALGQAITLTPLAAIAMVGISPAEAGSASGPLNMLRNLGGVIGTSALEDILQNASNTIC